MAGTWWQSTCSEIGDFLCASLKQNSLIADRDSKGGRPGCPEELGPIAPLLAQERLWVELTKHHASILCGQPGGAGANCAAGIPSYYGRRPTSPRRPSPPAQRVWLPTMAAAGSLHVCIFDGNINFGPRLRGSRAVAAATPPVQRQQPLGRLLRS